jgi:hypothetical protein
MSTTHILSLLIQERDRLNAAIHALQGAPAEESTHHQSMMSGRVKPASKKTPAKKGVMSAAGRARIAEANRKRWAALKASKEAPAKKASTPVAADHAVQRKRKPWTLAQKKAIGARTKAMWAAKRKAAAK